MSLLESAYRALPGIKKPDRQLTFKEKMFWSGGILLLFLIMSEVALYGMSQQSYTQFQQLEILLGSSIGKLITLGIGPIVTASIILQLLVGAKILNWDMQSQAGRSKFQGTQKLLSYAFGLFESIIFVSLGTIAPWDGSLAIGALLVLQLTVGSWSIILMDEVVSKWGFGSGISLFILAGVSKSLIIQLISPLTFSGQLYTAAGSAPVGVLLNLILTPDIVFLTPILATILVFLLSIFALSMRVDIPLTFGNVRGFGRKWPLKFLYTGVLPVILISAFLMNIQLWASFAMGGGGGRDVLQSHPIFQYILAPSNFMTNLVSLNVTPSDLLHVLIYTLIYVLGAMVFSMFWMKTSGQDPESVANQIYNTGMGVPGFRRDKRVLVKILNRYIPQLTALGGAFIGFLSAFAGWTNAIGTGTGVLLAVMIVHQLYEELARKHLEDMHPLMRKFMGS